MLGRVRCLPFPDVVALIGSSDFLSPVGLSSGRPLLLGLPSESDLDGELRISQVTGPSSYNVPRWIHPARCTAVSPITTRDTSAFTRYETLGSGHNENFEAQ